MRAFTRPKLLAWAGFSLAIGITIIAVALAEGYLGTPKDRAHQRADRARTRPWQAVGRSRWRARAFRLLPHPIGASTSLGSRRLLNMLRTSFCTGTGITAPWPKHGPSAARHRGIGRLVPGSCSGIRGRGGIRASS
jgi:hypothetical protein